MPTRSQPSPLRRVVRDRRDSNLLLNYSVTKNGFLPSRAPLRRLSDPYYAPWEVVLDGLPKLIKEKSIRKAVDGLEVLSTDRLSAEEEWRRAYVILSFLTHGYIWGGDKPAEVLPPAISIPFLRVAHHLDLPPVATYAALNLWNFRSTGVDFRDLDSLEALHTFSGTEDESWFFVLSAAMEAQGAHIIPVMLRALEAVERRDYGAMIDGLDALTACIGTLGRTLDRMQEKCDPAVFYHQIRPYLAGTKNMEAAGLPNGVFYDEGNGAGSWRHLRGGSNGQSSLIQFFDAVLGVEHTSTGTGTSRGPPRPEGSSRELERPPTGSSREMTFHQEVRFYMPGPHRRFLESVSRMASLRDFAMLETSSSPEHRKLRQSFETAAKALGDFRHKHMQMVTRYIVIPSRKQTATVKEEEKERKEEMEDRRVNLATASSGQLRQESELTGTGGTALIPFLKQTRDETYAAAAATAI
ncbi:indoleamine 2,3-dioxygenase [Biscogniauxia mediterranea]|nr:indoleamine 2,3-dioxygenase [Biscogniauxia mediterranea]